MRMIFCNNTDAFSHFPRGIFVIRGQIADLRGKKLAHESAGPAELDTPNFSERPSAQRLEESVGFDDHVWSVSCEGHQNCITGEAATHCQVCLVALAASAQDRHVPGIPQPRTPDLS